MIPEQRAEALRARQVARQPWHSPPHGLERHWYHLSAACYEHAPILGASPERMGVFEQALLEALGQECERVCVWCVLPTHYHALIQCRSLPLCRRALGRLHGATSHGWNVAEQAAGRTCWHGCMIRPIKNEAHRWATVNYIHHNPVRHRYVERWQDWPFSSAPQYLAELGRGEAERIWRTYPILDMGENWDDESL